MKKNQASAPESIYLESEGFKKVKTGLWECNEYFLIKSDHMTWRFKNKATGVLGPKKHYVACAIEYFYGGK